MSSIATAQERSEISVYAGTGLSSFDYDNSWGKTNSKIVPVFGIGYTYNLGSDWGIVSGLEVAIYKSKAKSSKLQDHYLTSDNYGNDFEWRIALNDFKETQTGTYLNIPLMIQFKPESIDKIYANLGVKIGIPIKGKYESKYSQLVTSGYYPGTGVEYPDIDFRGLGEFDGKTSEGDLDLNVAFMLAAECGMKFQLSDNLKLYTGAYIDYGLNNIIKDNNKYRIISYDKNNPMSFEYNSILHSGYSDEDTKKSYVDKVIPLSFGVKVRLGFSL